MVVTDSSLAGRSDHRLTPWDGVTTWRGISKRPRDMKVSREISLCEGLFDGLKHGVCLLEVGQDERGPSG